MKKQIILVAKIGISLLLSLITNLHSIFADYHFKKDMTQVTVQINEGKIRGNVKDGLMDFKGIPYATPITGNDRWSLPKPPKSWSGVLDTTKYKSSCPQMCRYGLTEASYDEDCLYINVTAPLKEDKDTKLPVVVWIHGGAFVGGSSSLYPLDFIAKSGDVVAVSFNYRLGAFGFMPHPEFDQNHNGGFGLEDQREALRWVKRNIHAFGGDPDNITIAGESAGAQGVCMHLIAPEQTTGLFHKAIIQSGSCIYPMRTAQEGNKIGLKVAELVGCSNTKDSLRCLKGKSVKELLEAAAKVGKTDIMSYVPIAGTKTVPSQGMEAVESGKFVRVPIINGSTRDEQRLYVAYAMQEGAEVTPENYGSILSTIYGKNADAVLKKYPLSKFSSAPTALGTVFSDFRPDNGLNICTSLKFSKLAANHTPIYEFLFADIYAPAVTSYTGFEMGAVHSSELPYQFPKFCNTTKLDGPELVGPSKELSQQMVEYWTSFAKTGAPKSFSAANWKQFKTNGDVLRLEPSKIKHFDAWKEHNCDFWAELYSDILGHNTKK